MQTVDSDHDGAGRNMDWPQTAGLIPIIPPVDLQEDACRLVGCQEVPFFPPIVYIEPTNACRGVICPLCFRSQLFPGHSLSDRRLAPKSRPPAIAASRRFAGPLR